MKSESCHEKLSGKTMANCKIGIITFPLTKSAVVPLYNLISVVSSLTNQVYVITGNAGVDVAEKLKHLHFDLIHHTPGSNVITRIYNYTRTQLTITLPDAKIVTEC